MLQEIRERAQGWVAWAIVILISIPFALWGIQSYLGVGSAPVVAEVDGIEITDRQFEQAVQRTRMDLRERLGAAYDPALFGGQRLREQVLEQMITDALLLEVSQGMGLRVADAALRAAILSEPAFQNNGAFDKATYERVLELQGLTPAAYEEQLRRRLVSTQLRRAVFGTELVAPGEVDAAARLMRQQRELSFVRLSREAFAPSQVPSEDAIQAFYDENQARFQTPEQVRVAYLVLDAKALPTTGEVDEARLREVYESRLDSFREPERRTIRHILLSVPADADESTAEAAKTALVAARERILAGESFADVAAEVSQDTVSASHGGDLGVVERGMMDPAFEQAAFDLPKDELSEPVRSRFGYHLIEVTAIEGGETKPFEAVRDQLAKELGSGQSEGAFFDMAERLANLTYESPDSLVPAAEALDLKIQTTGWFDRSGGEGLFSNPRLVGAAFAEDVLVAGNNSEVIEPERDGLQAVVLRVEEHREPSVRPLDEVREEIVKAIRERDAAVAVLAAADAMVNRLEQGEALSVVAGESTVETPGLVGRAAPGIPPAVSTLAFSLPRPTDAGASFGSAAADNGDAVVVAVTRVEDGDASTLDAAARQSESRSIADALARSEYSQLLLEMEAHANIIRQLPAADDSEG